MPLSRFESLARRLVEGSFKRLFGGELEPLEIATHLARALEDSQASGHLADSFRIHLHPDDYDAVYRQNPRLANDLGTYMIQLAQQADFSLSARPQIELVADTTIAARQVWVESRYDKVAIDASTQVYRPPALKVDPLTAIKALDAFLIIEGRSHVPLDRSFMTIGRRMDNDIVLDSPMVSRRHAQIRWRYGRFVLYDLSRRGRTAVNKQPVTEHALQSGDVIALSDSLLIYGEGQEEIRRLQSGDDQDAPTLMMPPQEP